MDGAYGGYGVKQLEAEGQGAQMRKCHLTQMLTPCQLSFSVPVFRVVSDSPTEGNKGGRCAKDFWKLELDNREFRDQQ